MSGTMDHVATEVDQQELAQQFLAQAREQGTELVGPAGGWAREGPGRGSGGV
ncbi:hypothetical protein C8D78_3328 [Arthrobacter oryzae]|uniref:Uncharacterized protein n=1 Tax=Arthrobacter oryzae TaxID=409290 RepID=A0A495E9T3_9MICC|nr:hypothetical protein C8D78_3328 [Arthrobacter oryzae]